MNCILTFLCILKVMAIGRTFEESIQKALRMTHPALDGFGPMVSLEALPFTTFYRVSQKHVRRLNGYFEETIIIFIYHYLFL